MAVAIKKSGYSNIILYNGGLKDWLKSGHEVTTIMPLPAVEVHFVDVDELQSLLTDADARNCKDENGAPLLTLLDFRTAGTFLKTVRADKYQIKTKCWTINAQLDDFTDNQPLINSIPNTGQIITISETGNRDQFLIQFLSQFDKTNIRGLKYGMRNWIKAGYPTEKQSMRDL